MMMGSFAFLGSGPDRGRCPVEDRGEILSVPTYVRASTPRPDPASRRPDPASGRPDPALRRPDPALRRPDPALGRPDQPSGGLTRPQEA